MTLLEKFKGTLTAQNVFLDENTGGKGKYFKARFLQPGLVKYSFGVCLLDKEIIDKFINQFVGCPVIIGHKDVTNENAKELSCGNICHIWYDQTDGWYWGDGIIDNEEAISLINQGYNVSCQYEITEFANNTTNALHNGNPYDKVILNGKPEHLAIVDRPRYENAFIAVNALDLTAENEDKWITIKPNGEDGKGRPLLVKDGETVKEAVERKIAEWDAKKEEEKNEPKQLGLRGFSKLKKELEKDEKELEKKNTKEKNTIRKKINDLREAYDLVGKEYKNTKEWSKQKDYRDYMADLADRMDKAEREARQKYNLDDDSLEDFLNEVQKEEQVKKEEKQENYKSNLKKYKEAFEKLESDRFVSFEDFAKRENKQSDKEDKKEEIGENLPEYAKLRTMDKEELIKKYLINKDSLDPEDDLKFYKQFHQTELIDRIYKKHDKDKAKNCIVQAINEIKETDMFKKLFNRKDKQMDKDEMKSLFIECLQECLQAKNEADEKEKEDDKKDELEKEKEAANKCKNESVDKRDIIRKIMAIAGKEEASEDVKTIAKLAEKLAYDKSEAGTADNEDEDKKEEEAKNKAKNSIEEIKSLFSNIGVKKPASTYVTQKEAIELGNELF